MALTDHKTNNAVETGADLGTKHNSLIDALVTALAGKVATTGNETIAGVKTFSSFPITPSSSPTTDYQAANKKYIDDLIASAIPAKLRPRGWVTFNGTGATGAKTPTDSHNVSGVVKNGTGDYTISWDVDFADANYCVMITAGTGIGIGYIRARSAGSVQIGIGDVNGSSADDTMINVIAFGSQ